MAEESHNNSLNVGIGKPKSVGAIYVSTGVVESMPTDATSDLDTDTWQCLGYISDSGMTESEDSSIEEIQAWGGDIVARPQTSYGKTYNFSCLEINGAVMQLAYGSKNVELDDDGNIATVRHVSGSRPNISAVFEIVLSDTRIQRICVPICSVTELSDITYTDGEAVQREITLGALPDANGVVSYDYFATVEEDDTASPTSIPATTKKAASESESK